MDPLIFPMVLVNEISEMILVVWSTVISLFKDIITKLCTLRCKERVFLCKESKVHRKNASSLRSGVCYYFAKSILTRTLNNNKNSKNLENSIRNTPHKNNKKVQQERTKEAGRVSSYTSSVQINEPESSYDKPRHSSYVSSTNKKEKTATSNYSGNIVSKNRYAIEIPNVFHPYISDINDVRPDGHCGYRCVSLALFDHQEKYLYIRSQLLKELVGNESFWKRFFDPDNDGFYDDLYRKIQFSGPGPAPPAHWFDMPECGYLVANIFQMIVISIDIRGCSTISPMYLGPVEHEEPVIAPMNFVSNGHFILLGLRGSYPIPPADPKWSANKSDDAARWEYKYFDRIVDYVKQVYPEYDPNKTSDIVHVD